MTHQINLTPTLKSDGSFVYASEIDILALGIFNEINSIKAFRNINIIVQPNEGLDAQGYWVGVLVEGQDEKIRSKVARKLRKLSYGKSVLVKLADTEFPEGANGHYLLPLSPDVNMMYETPEGRRHLHLAHPEDVAAARTAQVAGNSTVH